MLFLVILPLQLAFAVSETPVYACESQIYCRGVILETVNRLRIFNDSKDFVDMPLRFPTEKILLDFQRRFPYDPKKITRETFISFLLDNFRLPGTELIDHVPSDWKTSPTTINLIQDEKYKEWAFKLNEIWKILSKKVAFDVANTSALYSLIYVPHAFIIPGGRFREYYNWDTYWILRGLYVSEMFLTARHMIENFAFLIDKFGFIPAGGRIYYLERSQPPLFVRMVYDYYNATGDVQFVASMMPRMEKELKFWMQNRSLDLIMDSAQKFMVYQYRTRSNVPRPEEFWFDVTVANELPEAQRSALFTDIQSNTEGGWDFTSRFGVCGDTLASQKTTKIIPVDLNAFMCGNFAILSEFSRILGADASAKSYKHMHTDMKRIMMTIFYNKTLSAWFDLDISTKKHNTNFYSSNLSPLFANCYDFSNREQELERILDYFMNSGGAKYPNGVPSSLCESGQQWDFPNGWPNQQHMIIEGFDATGLPKLQKAAFIIAEAWLSNNYQIFQKTGYMFEKYNISDQTTAGGGGGGEYNVQIGFGWTNGVALDLLKKYGQRLSSFVNVVSSLTDRIWSPQYFSLKSSTLQLPSNSAHYSSIYRLGSCLLLLLLLLLPFAAISFPILSSA